MKISIIIPAYNESEGVTQTASAVRKVWAELGTKYEVEIIFVNDGSKDATGDLLRTAFANTPEVSVLSHEVNRGLGAALRTGFAQATGDVVVTTDFDGTYSFDSISLLVNQLLTEGVDIVTASPYHPAGKVEGIPAFRLMFSFGASLLYRLLVSWRIHTWTALFRAYRQAVIKKISFQSNDFLAGTELLVNAYRQGFTVAEFPTTLHVRTFGQSSIKIARVTLAHIKFQTKILLAALRGKPHSIVTPTLRSS
ncbi:MAG: glycosyltransferase family 2 protein [Aggregatilineales bacterium]